MHSQTREEMFQIISEYHSLLRKSVLKAAPEKTFLFLKEVKFPGHLISEHGISPIHKAYKNHTYAENTQEIIYTNPAVKKTAYGNHLLQCFHVDETIPPVIEEIFTQRPDHNLFYDNIARQPQYTTTCQTNINSSDRIFRSRKSDGPPNPYSKTSRFSIPTDSSPSTTPTTTKTSYQTPRPNTGLRQSRIRPGRILHTRLTMPTHQRIPRRIQLAEHNTQPRPFPPDTQPSHSPRPPEHFQKPESTQTTVAVVECKMFGPHHRQDYNRVYRK